MKEKVIGLKDLRENMLKYTAEVQGGKTLVVVKRSRPLFRMVPLDEDEGWETLIDFREINTNGVPAEDILRALKKIREEEGRPAPSPKILSQTDGRSKKVSKKVTS